MTRYRNALPLLSDKLFMTDGGMETTLVFHDGIDLPCFAAFDLLKTKQGEQHIKEYYRRYADIALRHGVGMVLESVTWRASHGWGEQLGYSDIALDAINRQAIEILESLRDECETETSPMVVSGCVGPRGDGYDPAEFMTAEEARAYHSQQIETFADTAADMISAMTITYAEEAIGIAQAAADYGLPVAISFTVETDGCLPSGQSLQDAIETVDNEVDVRPAYYMINCAHPTHFEHVLDSDEAWVSRIRGIRANASCKSHAELDESTELDDGNPVELGQQYKAFKRKLKNLTVVGGCCGTDHRHIEHICRATLAAA